MCRFVEQVDRFVRYARIRESIEMAEVDRVTARALVEVGYMPLRVYIERFARVAPHEHICSPATAPDMCEASEPVLQAYAFTLVEQS